MWTRVGPRHICCDIFGITTRERPVSLIMASIVSLGQKLGILGVTTCGCLRHGDDASVTAAAQLGRESAGLIPTSAAERNRTCHRVQVFSLIGIVT